MYVCSRREENPGNAPDSKTIMNSNALTMESVDNKQTQGKAGTLRVLVAIASHGTKNEPFLLRLLAEYRAMPYKVDIVVLSNIPRELGPDIEVRVGYPTSDPWSLPFGHKQLFADRANDYDLFIYSEDDVLITRRNLEAFLAATEVLPKDVIAGFVHIETDKDGATYYDPLESHFHWDPASVRSVGDYKLAFFTNEHSACYVLSQAQLKKAIQSGGFLVAPYAGRYDMLCAASTDPYTRCGFKKLVPLSHVQDFSVAHLPNNKYAERPYRGATTFFRQVNALLDLESDGRPRTLLFEPETKVLNAKWSKSYYETVQNDVLALVPQAAKKVLSIGCGWGWTERELIKQGKRVVGVPIDAVIGACAEHEGVEMVYADFAGARQKLEKERFDCVLFINVLHLVPQPERVLASFAELLAAGGTVIVAAPNFASVMTYWRSWKGDPFYKELGNFEKTGMHATTPAMIKEWFTQGGLKFAGSRNQPFERAQKLPSTVLAMAGALLASDLVMAGRKSGSK